ncbi:hypothetical protein CHU98_g2552 [Xylaria longipes]|nr:hypothetical protein CHU98_g2552 [Xylaria longipes]
MVTARFDNSLPKIVVYNVIFGLSPLFISVSGRKGRPELSELLPSQSVLKPTEPHWCTLFYREGTYNIDYTIEPGEKFSYSVVYAVYAQHITTATVPFDPSSERRVLVEIVQRQSPDSPHRGPSRFGLELRRKGKGREKSSVALLLSLI